MTLSVYDRWAILTVPEKTCIFGQYRIERKNRQLHAAKRLIYSEVVKHFHLSEILSNDQYTTNTCLINHGIHNVLLKYRSHLPTWTNSALQLPHTISDTVELHTEVNYCRVKDFTFANLRLHVCCDTSPIVILKIRNV